MPTLTTSYQYLGSSPENGPVIASASGSTTYYSRFYLQAKVQSYNASNATIRARVSIRNTWMGWRSQGTIIALTGASTYQYVNSGSTTWTGAYGNGQGSGSKNYAEMWSAEYDFNVSYGTFNLGATVSSSAGYGATISKQSCTVNAPAPTTWTVSYNANGGTGAPAAQTKTKDVTLTLSSTTPTRASQTTTGATVTFNDDWGTPLYNTYTTVGATVSYTFANWNTAADGSGTSYSVGGSYTANEAATLYAQWTTSQTADGTVKLPTSSPGNLGSFKYFVGWTTTKGNLNTRVQDGFVATSNMTVYAYWADVNSKFKYKNNGNWEIL